MGIPKGNPPHGSSHHVHICGTSSLSWTLQVAYIIATVGLANLSGCLVSQGASIGVEDGESLSRHSATPLKPGGSVISSLGSGDPGNDVKLDFSVACFCSSAHQCQALLPALQLLHHHLSLLRVRGVPPAGITGWVGCSTSIQPRKLLHGTSPFSLFLCHKGGIPDSSASSLTMAIGVAGSSLGSSVGATSSVDTSAGVSSSVGPSISCGVGGFQIPQPAH